MRFGDFHIFVYLGWIVPVLFLFYLWAKRSQNAAMEKFAQKELLPGIASSYQRDTTWKRTFLNIAAVFFIVFALARPQWGFFWQEQEQKGIDIIIAVDSSKSMLAVDMRPDRLDFSKTELREFVKKLKGDRVGLIAFAGQAFLQCPLTADYSGFLLAVKDLNIHTIPKGGTSLPSAIDEAIRSYKGAETKNKVLIIITDGENTEGDVTKAVEKAKKAGITISCIGIGSAKGEVIPILDEKGNKTYIKDKEGKIVKSRLMEDTLKMIAKKTGGIYVKASQADLGLNKIYQKQLSKLEKQKTDEKRVKVYKERFQFPLALVFLALLYGYILEKKRGRRKK